MRKILLTGTSLLLLTAGAALADQHNQPSTVVNVPIVKNAGAGGSGTNSSATTGGVAVSASLSNSANNNGNTATANSNNESVMKVIGSNYAANGATLSTTNSRTHVDITLATAVSNGSVSHNEANNMPHEARIDASAGQAYVNGGTGILTASQNTGANSLQQTTVALGSAIAGSNNTLP